jgi:hypothetical protein
LLERTSDRGPRRRWAFSSGQRLSAAIGTIHDVGTLLRFYFTSILKAGPSGPAFCTPAFVCLAGFLTASLVTHVPSKHVRDQSLLMFRAWSSHVVTKSTMTSFVPSSMSPSRTDRLTRAVRQRRSLPATLLAMLVSLAGVGSTSVAEAASAKGITIKKATFAREVTDEYEAKGVTTEFQTSESVFLLVQIKGRPKKGKVSATWSFRGKSVATADIDLADVSKGVLFSIGQDTYATFNLTPGPAGLVVGNSYSTTIKFDGAVIDTYKFAVVPPKTALVSKVTATRLSNAKEGPALTKFAPTDTVYLLFEGDFGVKSWVEATWQVNGKKAPEATRSLNLTEDGKDLNGNFTYVPKGGWPKGSHSVMLVLNDVTVGTYKFTVA